MKRMWLGHGQETPFTTGPEQLLVTTNAVSGKTRRCCSNALHCEKIFIKGLSLAEYSTLYSYITTEIKRTIGYTMFSSIVFLTHSIHCFLCSPSILTVPSSIILISHTESLFITVFMHDLSFTSYSKILLYSVIPFSHSHFLSHTLPHQFLLHQLCPHNA